MSPEEQREQKILKATQDGFLTRTAIHKAIGGGQVQVYSSVERMAREGLLERGPDTVLKNQHKIKTYRASSGPPVAEKEPGDFFHGRAPSVFEWRGHFSLREMTG